MAGKDPAQDGAPEWIGSPEFQAAVQAAALQIAGTLAPASSGDDVLGRLALNIAELTDQGSGRKRVDPKIVVARRAAKERMFDLLADLQADGVMPEWRLRNKVQLVLAEGETVLEPVTVGSDKRPMPTEISYLGVPNLAMEPTNEPARRLFALYCESTESASGTARPGWTVTRGGMVLQDAITPDGKVLRGRAAASILNRDTRRSGDPSLASVPEHGLPHLASVIRRNGVSDVVETRVLGSLAEPARQTP